MRNQSKKQVANLKRKYEDMLKEFIRLQNIRTPGNNQQLTYEAIYEKLEQKFYMTPGICERIVRREMQKEGQKDKQGKLDL